MDNYTNLIVCCISITWLVIEKIYHNATDIVYVTLLVDVYVMLCVHVVLFYALKEGAGGSRWKGEDGVVLYIYIYLMKEGASGSW